MNRRGLLGGAAATFAATALSACNAPARLASLPERLRAKASFLDLPEDYRIVLDHRDNELLAKVAVEALDREVDYAERTGASLGPADFLAISGGGENGAFGAGLLTAWSSLGTRPNFKVVTGVSTGALSAPFAFLGPAYDDQLEYVYTRILPSDVMTSRGLITAALSDSLYDSTPLLHTIRRFATPALLAAIAREYNDKGRLLFVATTNLDVPVGVLWNMGAIAGSGHPQAADLFARILLASASVPGVFPPVMLDVEVGGERYQEMHVDGGTVAQVVLYPASFGGADLAKHYTAANRRLYEIALKRRRRLFVIRNSRPGPDIETVARSTVKIATRALSSLIQTQGIGDLYQLYLLCQRDGIDYNVTFIPESFNAKPSEPFDPGYMRKLYQLGRDLVAADHVWSKLPPGFDPTPIHRG